jgi:hypothetical protein
MFCNGPAHAGSDASPVGVDGRPVMAKTTTELTRSDMPSMAGRDRPGHSTGVTEVAVQRWASAGRAGIGVGLGSVMLVDAAVGSPPGSSVDNGAARTTATGTTMMLGLRYRTTAESSIYADATRLGGLGLSSDDRIISKVGVEFKAAQSNWRINYGGIGLRFAGDTRMTVRLRRSGLAIGMRKAF